MTRKHFSLSFQYFGAKMTSIKNIMSLKLHSPVVKFAHVILLLLSFLGNNNKFQTFLPKQTDQKRLNIATILDGWSRLKVQAKTLCKSNDNQQHSSPQYRTPMANLWTITRQRIEKLGTWTIRILPIFLNCSKNKKTRTNTKRRAKNNCQT